MTASTAVSIACIRGQPTQIVVSGALAKSSESYSENVRRRSRSTCGCSFVSSRRFERALVTSASTPDISLHCANWREGH
jgi:hypothetical protein